MRMGRSVASTVRAFVPDQRVAQMVDHFTQYVGSAPDASPAVLCGIAHMQTQEGIWYPRGGTACRPARSAQLWRSSSASRFVLGTDVTRITSTNGRVTGVEIEQWRANQARRRRFESRCRPHASRAARRRLRQIRTPPPLRARLFRRGALSRFAQAPSRNLLHHNFVFSADPARGVRLHLSPGRTRARSDLLRLRPGASAIRGRARTAAKRFTSWSTRPICGRITIGRRCCPRYRRVDPRQAATHRLAWTWKPISCRKRAHSAGYSRTLPRAQRRDLRIGQPRTFTGAFKPNNRSPDLQGLYLAGGAAHPGPGMPMVLMSGWIAADALDADAGSSARRGAIETQAMVRA